MPKERKDTQPTAQEEGAQGSPDGFESSGEISVAAVQLAAVTLADDGEAGPGASESQQQDGAAECHDPLSDPELWKPPPPTEDCPVCLVPLTLEAKKTIYWSCCGKMICTACKYEHIRALEITNRKREKKELPPLDRSCAFCRAPVDSSDSVIIQRVETLVDKGDDLAMVNMAIRCRDGQSGLPKDEARAIELFKKAADMGSGKAMNRLGYVYFQGAQGVPKDEKKGIEYLKDAVKLGDIYSRHDLACVHANKGNFHLAIKHFRLAAEAGHKLAVKQIWKLFSMGKLSKTDLEEILRAHQAACDEMDSEDRRRADAFEEAMAGNDDTLERIYGSYYHGYVNAKQLEEALEMHRKGSEIADIQKFLRKCGTGK